MKWFLTWLLLHQMIRWGVAGLMWLTALVLPAAPVDSHEAAARGSGEHSAEYCMSCARDSRGRIARSRAVTEEFKQMTGYPHGRPGYVIDHIVPLCHNGPDVPSNLQWQTKAEAHEKDLWECK
jgi:hypothetical protein